MLALLAWLVVTAFDCRVYTVAIARIRNRFQKMHGIYTAAVDRI